MKIEKIFIVLAFLLAFAVCVSAQNNQYPNEIEGYEFFKSGRFNDLKLLISDRDAVKAVFGEKCDNSCDYDEDWEISFSYINSGWNKKLTENGKEQIYRPKQELVGKLAGITFRSKKLILLSEYAVIPKEIKCSIATSYGKYTYKSRSCIDDKRVNYNISDETLENKEIVKGQIISINYVPSKKDDDDIYVLVDK
jgi:hypothetical protein